MPLTRNLQASPSVTIIIVTASCMRLWDMRFNQQTTQEATATFLLLPGWLGWSKNGYICWLNKYPEHACVLATFSAKTRKIIIGSVNHSPH